MSAGHDAEIRQEVRELRQSIFALEMEYAIEGLLKIARDANDRINGLPEKFHAPYIAIMTVAQDAIQKLRLNKKPKEYWITDDAAEMEDYMLDRGNVEANRTQGI